MSKSINKIKSKKKVGRICEPNLTYHTFSRCIEKRNLIKLNKSKELMIKVIKMALEKYKFEIMSYAIMDNHFHFLIRTVKGGPTISRIMQFIKSQYARRYNKLMKRCGPFWNERFGDTIIEEQKNPKIAFNFINNYIMYNPVRANYVSDPRNYKYTCIHFYIDEDYKPPIKLTRHKYFQNLGKNFMERSQKFLKIEDLYRRRILETGVY